MAKKSRTYRRTPDSDNPRKKKNLLRRKEVYKKINKRELEEMIYEDTYSQED